MLKTAENTECQAFFPVVRIGPPTPSPPRESCHPPFVSKRGDTLACGEGGAGGPNYDEGTDTLVLYVYYNPSTLKFSTKSGKNSSGKTFAIFEQDKFISAYELKIVIGLLNTVCEIIFLCH
jgi:hypothetical protein